MSMENPNDPIKDPEPTSAPASTPDKPAETKPEEGPAQPAETKPEEGPTQPAETKPEEGPTQPAETKPEEGPAQPAETKPEEGPETEKTLKVEPSNGEDTRTPEELNEVKEKILQNKLKHQNEQKILMIKKKIDSDGGAASSNTRSLGPVAPPSDDTNSSPKSTEDYGWGGNDPDAPYEDSHFSPVDSLYKDADAENAQLANNIALKNLRNMSK